MNAPGDLLYTRLHPGASVDINILRHPEQPRTEWFDQCLRSVRTQPCNIYVVQGGAPEDIHPLRKQTLFLGSAPFVAFVDDDDYLLPNAIEKCLRAFGDANAVITLEKILCEGVGFSRMQRKGHHLLMFRRDKAEAGFKEYTGNSLGSPQTIAKTITGYKQLDFAGYVWRRHSLGVHLECPPMVFRKGAV